MTRRKHHRIHTPVYPVCVEHYFNQILPFDAISFLEARVQVPRRN
jgi:hypothetical protein